MKGNGSYPAAQTCTVLWVLSKFFEALFSRVFSSYGQTYPAVAKRMCCSVFTLDSHRGTSVPLFGMLGMPKCNYIVALFCFIVHMEMSNM